VVPRQEVGWVLGPVLTMYRRRNSLVPVGNRTQVVGLSSMWPSRYSSCSLLHLEFAIDISAR
jgi:hypothetical protein